MKPPAIRRIFFRHGVRRSERGVTMVLVALAMVAIIAMAALSIDVITLYLAKEEAQRSADAAALAAARVISISGITGDPNNASGSWLPICGGSSSAATMAAQAALQQNAVAGAVVVPNPQTPAVTYSAGNGSAVSSNVDCTQLTSTAFGVNPMVTVFVQQTALPTFFSRIWGRTAPSVSATATAEAFNPSNSGNVGNLISGAITPVQPRCVKPWIVPNLDPMNPTSCTNATCAAFVNLGSGQIIHEGISTGGGNANGVIGETFWLSPDCVHNSSPCGLRKNPPEVNYYPNNNFYQHPPSLEYLPGETLYASTAVPSTTAPNCSAKSGSLYEQAIEGCDQATVYQCGVQNGNKVDLSENPGKATNDTMNGVQCLIHQPDAANTTSSSGQDYLAGTSFAAPTPYPFQILTGSGNPLATMASPLPSGTPVTSSNSIVSLPIYDQTAGTGQIRNNGKTDITIVGFLQVFINAADQSGNVSVTVLNVTGCGNGSPLNSAVTGSSPVPVRLITPQ
jgi:Flp pilus assembly protein TadG